MFDGIGDCLAKSDQDSEAAFVLEVRALAAVVRKVVVAKAGAP